jgi:ABC-type nickel/cobalt efflux system permease component RcnA
MTTTAVIVIIAVIIVAAIAAWYFMRQRRSQTLRSRFGPEYEHAVRQYGGQAQAEEALLARQRRRERLHIHSLSRADRDRFEGEWHDVQARFVDDPPGSIRDADRLVNEALDAAGG